MEQFLRAIALVLVAVIVILVVGKQSKDIGLVLSMAVCVVVLLAGAAFLEPVIDFLREVQILGNLDAQFLTILLKAAGIGLLSELAGLICSDAGESAMGKAIQMLANAAIAWLSLPLLRQLLALLEEVLGQI